MVLLIWGIANAQIYSRQIGNKSLIPDEPYTGPEIQGSS